MVKICHRRQASDRRCIREHYAVYAPSAATTTHSTTWKPIPNNVACNACCCCTSKACFTYGTTITTRDGCNEWGSSPPTDVDPMEPSKASHKIGSYISHYIFYEFYCSHISQYKTTLNYYTCLL